MAAEPATVQFPSSPVPAWIICTLWTIVPLSALFAALIFIIPINDYRFEGNCLEVILAVFCMLCCLYAYRYIADQLILLLASFAFFIYALTTIFWYLYTFPDPSYRMHVFSTPAEFGFLCFFLFFIAAISTGFSYNRIQASTALGCFAFFSFILVAILWIGGDTLWSDSDNTLFRLALLVIQFLFTGYLVAIMISHRITRHRLLFAGISLFCATMTLYGIRETLITQLNTINLVSGTGLTAHTAYEFMSIIGPMIICSFALIQLGLFSYLANDMAGSQCG